MHKQLIVILLLDVVKYEQDVQREDSQLQNRRSK